MRSGRVPGDWREANVMLIFKKDLRIEVGNYRRVSLTSGVCKMMESVEICGHGASNKK